MTVLWADKERALKWSEEVRALVEDAEPQYAHNEDKMLNTFLMTVLKEELVVTGDTPRTWLWNIVCAYERWWYEQTNGKQLTHSYYTKEYVREFCEWQYLLTRFEMMLSGGVVRVLRPAITHRWVNVGGIRVRMPKG